MTRLAAAAALGFALAAIGTAASGFDGAWTARVPGPSGQAGAAVTFALHVEGDRASGTVSTGDRSFALVDVKITGATIAFAVEGEEQNRYSGTLKEDEIAFQVRYPSHENGTRVWSFVAKRAAASEPPASSIAGDWEGEVPRGGGRTIAARFTFQTDGPRLSGSVHAVGDEFPIEKGTVSGAEIAFRVGSTEGAYSGTVGADEIRMKVRYDGGESGRQTLPFVLKRVR
jgi:hypothetical protein